MNIGMVEVRERVSDISPVVYSSSHVHAWEVSQKSFLRVISLQILSNTN